MKKKLTLDIDALDVESFSTDAADTAGRGTVRAHQTVVTCADYTCYACQYTLACVSEHNCGGSGSPQTCYIGCGGPTSENCRLPSTSCPPTETIDQMTCMCLYQNTDIRLCCSDDAYCTGGGMC